MRWRGEEGSDINCDLWNENENVVFLQTRNNKRYERYEKYMKREETVKLFRLTKIFNLQECVLVIVLTTVP